MTKLCYNWTQVCDPMKLRCVGGFSSLLLKAGAAFRQAWLHGDRDRDREDGHGPWPWQRRRTVTVTEKTDCDRDREDGLWPWQRRRTVTVTVTEKMDTDRDRDREDGLWPWQRRRTVTVTEKTTMSIKDSTFENCANCDVLINKRDLIHICPFLTKARCYQ